MTPGSVFFHEEFEFHDGESGEKLFVVLGNIGDIAIVAKTTSRQKGKGTVYGCQPKDRLHNFFIPPNVTYLKKTTWICLNEFYEIDIKEALRLRVKGTIKPVCTFKDAIIREIQDCALESEDISRAQHAAVTACLI
ncbi:hypothetical protein ACLBX9_12825 [Methylobacterium sp. A49B]